MSSRLRNILRAIQGKPLELSVVTNNDYSVECVGADGKVKWVDGFRNIVVTTGLNKYLDATIKTGLASPAWYVALKGTGSIIAADTMASHGGWTTLSNYSNATNPAYTTGTISAGSVSNTASKAVFTINGSATVAGAFMCDNSAVGGATGILFGGGDFGTPRAVISGDTLNVTITCSLT